ncbi:MAG: DUF362 domain-containing protein [Archaeoglobaceae archaeon]|nr:DUF362 domain-containing protein [Archaeoglobaceae archaeon]MDW7989373.1 DUF362 domain-containing protein [Archaeoglobaceae archaeon]
MPKVFVEKVDDYEKIGKIVDKIFEIFGIEKCHFLKPNFLKFDNPNNGCITHPTVVKEILRCAKEYGCDLSVIEGGFFKKSAEECFKAFGIDKIARCVNLNEDEFLKVEICGKVLKSVKMAKIGLEARNKFISVPKMKVHHLTKVTLGIKNNMGFLKKPAVYMHLGIDQKLIDLLKFTKPRITIIDGIISGNLSEMFPKPLKHGVMIASDDVVACDFVASLLMNINPFEVGHIRLAMENFELKTEDIEIIGNFETKKYSLSLFNRFFSRLKI